MSKCLFDRIEKREALDNFLRSTHENKFYIKYEDSKDCPEHFIKWIVDFIHQNNKLHFRTEEINISSIIPLNTDPFYYIEKRIQSYEKFDKFRKQYSEFTTKQIEAKKQVINDNKPKIKKDTIKDLTNITYLLTKLNLATGVYEPEKRRKLIDQFYKGLKEYPNLLFIIKIDAMVTRNILEKFEEIVPNIKDYKNKFIFVVKKLHENISNTEISKIKEYQIREYLEANQDKLNINKQDIDDFIKDIRKYPAKYSEIRSKAVDTLNFDKFQDCHKTTKF